MCIWSWNSFVNFGPKEVETSPKNVENSAYIYLPENGGKLYFFPVFRRK